MPLDYARLIVGTRGTSLRLAVSKINSDATGFDVTMPTISPDVNLECAVGIDIGLKNFLITRDADDRLACI